MAFSPALAPPATIARRVWFLVHRDGLIVRQEADAASLPGDDDLAALGLTPSAAEYLGQLDDAHAFTAWVDGTPAPPFAVRNLRSLYGALDDEKFAVAGRATQVATWAVTHRFCGRCGAP
jgi:NAD+ diphosphatase